MKKIIVYCSLIVLLAMQNSCKKNSDLFTYDNSKSALYFGYTYATEVASINKQKGIDSISFSFVSIDPNKDKHTLKIPVHIVGHASAEDREYAYTVVSEESTLEPAHYKISHNIIRKNQFTDSLVLVLSKHDALRIKAKRLTIKLQPNKHFDQGYINNQKIKIDVSNILLKPDWWTTWESVFGPYSQEKYQIWSIVYHEKADGYMNYTYNYKNMPSRAHQGWYPSTFVFISQLKEYFEKNLVYEGGNPANPRVSIPYQF